MFPQIFEYLSNNINVALAFIFDINQNVIQVDNYKNVKFFGQDLIDITLEAGRYVW